MTITSILMAIAGATAIVVALGIAQLAYYIWKMGQF